MNRLQKFCELIGDMRERWFFFPLDWERRRQLPWIDRPKFWHRAAARRCARRLVKRPCGYRVFDRDRNAYMAAREEIAAIVLSEVGGYKVTTADVIAAGRIPSLVDRFIDRIMGKWH